MRTHHKTATCIISLFFLITTPLFCRGDTTLTVYGLGSIENGNLAQAERRALDDAFAKAALQASLRFVPDSSIADLMQSLPEYTASRRMQDILQYQIASRARQGNVLQLSVDVKIDDDSLRQWLHSRALTIPRAHRSRVLLAISYLEPGSETPYEWWAGKAGKAYSPFESQFGRELSRLGENVISPGKQQGVAHYQPDPLDSAHALGVDVLITGTIAYTPVLDTLYECLFEVSLVDVVSGAVISSWSVSRRGDFPTEAMNSLMIGEIITPVRAGISKRILSESPGVMKKTLCVEGISDYVTYQSMINALMSIEGVSRISITGIHGHSICHVMEIKGSLFDAMENLKRRQIAKADILVENEAAYIRILQN